MDEVRPCSCDCENDECRRSGYPMTGRLYELCSGKGKTAPVSATVSEKYRRLWDSRGNKPPTPGQAPAGLPGYEEYAKKREEAFKAALPTPEEEAEYPSLRQMGANFVREYRCWRAAGYPVVSEEVFKQRYSLCLVCDKYDPIQDRCKSCGCSATTTGKSWLSRAVNFFAGNVKQLGALWWATKRCPHPQGPKWLNLVRCDGTKEGGK